MAGASKTFFGGDPGRRATQVGAGRPQGDDRPSRLDDPEVPARPLADLPLGGGTGLHDAHPRDVAFDHEHARRVGIRIREDCVPRDEHRLFGLRQRHLRGCEHSRTDPTVGIRYLRLDLDGSCRRIECGADGGDSAFDCKVAKLDETPDW